MSNHGLREMERLRFHHRKTDFGLALGRSFCMNVQVFTCEIRMHCTSLSTSISATPITSPLALPRSIHRTPIAVYPNLGSIPPLTSPFSPRDSPKLPSDRCTRRKYCKHSFFFTRERSSPRIERAASAKYVAGTFAGSHILFCALARSPKSVPGKPRNPPSGCWQ